MSKVSSADTQTITQEGLDFDTEIEMKVSDNPTAPAKPLRPTKKSSIPSVAEERRKNQRFPLRSRVTMVWGKSVYRTFTLDASLDGLRLADPVPKELVGKVVDCYLFKLDANSGLHFRGVLVGAPTERVRLRFVDQEAVNQAGLQKWISSLKK